MEKRNLLSGMKRIGLIAKRDGLETLLLAKDRHRHRWRWKWLLGTHLQQTFSFIGLKTREFSGKKRFSISNYVDLLFREPQTSNNNFFMSSKHVYRNDLIGNPSSQVVYKYDYKISIYLDGKRGVKKWFQGFNSKTSWLLLYLQIKLQAQLSLS